jgi:hypothetical protein
LLGVVTFGPSNTWAVGTHGAILHWDGAVLSAVPSGTTEDLLSMWAAAPNDIWASGAGGTLLHYDGAAWTAVPSGVADDLTGLWGTGPNDVWALGGIPQYFLHWNGTQWSKQVPGFLGPNEYVAAIGGSAANDAWAVGWYDISAHFNGLTWNKVSTGTNTAEFTGVFAVAPNDVWATGIGSSTAMVRRWNGTMWTAGPTTGLGSELWLGPIWASSAADVWSVSHVSNCAFHYTAASGKWTCLDLGALPGSVHGTAANNVWTVAASGQVHRWDGAALSRISAPSVSCSDVGGLSAAEVWAACGKQLARFDGASWTTVAVPGLATTERTVALWVAGPGDVWVTTSAGKILRYAAGTWTTSVTFAGSYLDAIFGTSSSDIWVADGTGALARYNGLSWSAVPSGVTSAIQRIWGAAANDIWLAASSYMLHFDGTSITKATLPGGAYPTWVHGSSPTDVWAASNKDTLHWNGSKWTLVTSGQSDGLVSLWVAGPNDVFAIGYNQTFLHYNGATWSAQPAPTANSTAAIWGAAPRDLFVVGDGVLRYK